VRHSCGILISHVVECEFVEDTIRAHYVGSEKQFLLAETQYAHLREDYVFNCTADTHCK